MPTTESGVILAGFELLVADEMEKASQVCLENPVAMQLREKNMTCESIKEQGPLMVLPSGIAW